MCVFLMLQYRLKNISRANDESIFKMYDAVIHAKRRLFIPKLYRIRCAHNSFTIWLSTPL